MKKILVVEDEIHLSELIKYNLHISGYDVTTSFDGQDALNQIKTNHFDLILLDVMLPFLDGFSLLKYIKSSEELKHIPVIMLTAKNTESDIVLGLESGAIDYIPKPFNVGELLARVKLRIQDNAPTTANTIEWEDVIIDKERHTVTKHGEKIQLTNKEFDMLVYLMEHEGKVYTRDELLSHIWGYDYYGGTRTVDVHIRSLRKKVVGHHITTIIGVGYKFETVID